MPTPNKGPRLGGSPQHERLILANLATQLFEHGKITTTETKAKRLRPVAEKLITAAKRGTLHDRRQVMKTVRDKDVIHKLFAEIGPGFATRDGGYLRIVKAMPRKGDNAQMAVIELIGEETVSTQASRVTRRAASGSPRRGASPVAGQAADTAASRPAASGTGATATDVSAAGTADADADASSDQTSAAGSEDPAEGAVEAGEAGATAEVEESASTEDKPFGPDSRAALEDGSQPEGFPIKGNADSMLYHLPDSAFYDRTDAEVWFASPEAAEAAGFQLPPSQREEPDAGDEKTDA